MCRPKFSLFRTFGEVFCALDIRSLEKVAVKTMDLNDNYEEDLVMEIAMMKTLSHPNIVKYIDSYIVKDKLWVRSFKFNIFFGKFLYFFLKCGFMWVRFPKWDF
jgi:serine/threonine protein kinase